MSGWNTNFDELPEKATEVIVQYKGGTKYNNRFIVRASRDVAESVRGKAGGSNEAIAWHPMPKPYIPPKPEQISSDDSLVPYVGAEELIRQVEERTREIVAWEQKYEVKK